MHPEAYTPNPRHVRVWGVECRVWEEQRHRLGDQTARPPHLWQTAHIPLLWQTARPPHLWRVLILLVRMNCVVIFVDDKLKKNRFPRIRWSTRLSSRTWGLRDPLSDE